ncbi:MAG: hypothetical protein HYZ38_19130 [Mycobacterium sp.]|nr:hypothetical protein [Mycobacterium sp.]
MFEASLVGLAALVLMMVAFVIGLPPGHRPRGAHAHPPAADIGIGTVRYVAEYVTVEVESVCGERFMGRLQSRDGDRALAQLRPGVLLMVAFDPTTREQLSLADDMLAVRSSFDQMLLRKGLLSIGQLELIRTGVRASGVVTASRDTGEMRDDHHEVELDLIVNRPEGGQFAAQETALIPESALDEVAPGSVVTTYYRRGDESVVAVCVPPA